VGCFFCFDWVISATLAREGVWNGGKPRKTAEERANVAATVTSARHATIRKALCDNLSYSQSNQLLEGKSKREPN